MTDPKSNSSFQELVYTVEILRSEHGCAWDSQQTHESLVRYLIEETYETVAAIEERNDEDLKEELGDVLYQIVFHASIASQRGAFTIDDVADAVNQKMIRRHPHVFPADEEEDQGLLSDREVSELKRLGSDTPIEELSRRWEEIKRAEKTDRTSVLDGIPRGMPALLLGDKLLGKAKNFPQLTEQFSPETVTEITDAPFPSSEQELGDLLLRTIFLSKQAGMDSERALRTRLTQFMTEIQAEEETN